MSISVRDTRFRLLPMRTRMPFRYGIATVRKLQHLILQVAALVDGEEVEGHSADHLAPRWFVKDPTLTVEDEVQLLLSVIQHACQLAEELREVPSPFDLWWEVYQAQMAWAHQENIAPLVASFGVSLIERAAIDAFCRAKRVSFAQALRRNMLGLDLGRIHPSLRGAEPGNYLPAEPLREIIVRHTVGLSDPLTDADIPPDERLDDGLPQSLEDCIQHYGLTHFKIKLGGDAHADHERLRALSRLLSGTFYFTLDANEMYPDIEAFRSLWEHVCADAALTEFRRALLFVEQPLARDEALSERTHQELLRWRDKPPVIIDESDAELRSLATALDIGYHGCSVKSCKGVFKGIVNLCLAESLSRQGRGVLISGEDLTTVPPISLLQDLALMANLGIPHVERNSYHYFRGLTMLSQDEQDRLLATYPDLFTRHPLGFVVMHVTGGRVSTTGVAKTAFGQQ